MKHYTNRKYTPLFEKSFFILILSNIYAHGTTLDQAYFQLAQALQESNQEKDAIVYLEKTLAYNPEHPQALYRMGMHWYGHGDIPAAYSYLERACVHEPHNTHALLHAGICAMSLQQLDRAIEYYQQTIALEPQNPKTHFLLGHAYMKKQCLQEAIKEFDITLKLSPHSVDTLLSLGNALRDTHQLQAAFQAYEKAIALDPYNQKIVFEKAQACAMQGDIHQAHALYQELYTKNGTSQTLMYNIAHLYKKIHAYDHAIKWYQKLLAESPNFYQARLALAQAYLATNRYYEGFQELALSVQNHISEKPILESLLHAKNKTILITAAWNNEDMIQLLRFVPVLKTIGASIVVQADARLAPILALCPFIDSVITPETKQIPPFDAYISILSLPALCVTNENQLPAFKPYITIPKQLTTRWQSKMNTRDMSLHVGIYWKSQEQYDNQAENKNIIFEVVDHLAQKTDLRCYALQQLSAQELDQLSNQATLTILSKNISIEKDILPLCACISALDIIITRDSLVAHLAGAMGKTTLLIVPKQYEWRWVAQENQSCFYPSLHIIHDTQSNPQELVSQIMECIGKYSRENNCGIIA